MTTQQLILALLDDYTVLGHQLDEHVITDDEYRIRIKRLTDVYSENINSNIAVQLLAAMKKL